MSASTSSTLSTSERIIDDDHDHYQNGHLLMAFFKSTWLFICSLTVLTLTAFSIATTFRCEVFFTAGISDAMTIVAGSLFIVAWLFQLSKRWISSVKIHVAFVNHEHNPELNNLFRGARFLATITTILSLVVFAWEPFRETFCWCNMFYFGAICVFMLFVRIGSRTMVSGHGTKQSIWAFICDYGLLALCAGLYVQINFLEARETMQLYQLKKPHCISGYTPCSCHNTTSHLSLMIDTVVGDHHDISSAEYLNEIVKSAVYAIAVEVLALLYICNVEQKHALEEWKVKNGREFGSEESVVNSEEQEPAESASGSHIEGAHGPEVTADVESEPLTGNVNDGEPLLRSDQIADVGHPNPTDVHLEKLLSLTKWDRLVFGFGMVIFVGCSAGFLAVYIKERITRCSASAEHVIWCRVAVYSLMTAYVVGLFANFQPWNMRLSLKKASQLLDVRLLRWSTYGTSLLVLLFFVGAILGPKVPHVQSWYNYLHQWMNIVQFWIQYSFLYHLVAMNKRIEHRLERLPHGHKMTRIWNWKIFINTIPLLLMNAVYWCYNLWQWKVVQMLPLPVGMKQSPGSVWAVTEGILTPIAIFYRFHSCFLCYVLSDVPAIVKPWLIRLRFWRR